MVTPQSYRKINSYFGKPQLFQCQFEYMYMYLKILTLAYSQSSNFICKIATMSSFQMD